MEASLVPRRDDLHRILIIGSGPIIIGQACEFDYSGTQAAKALKADGYEVILVNSNPATIMTDPELADKTYIEPLTAPYVEEIIRRERPDALLSTVGGQTALNLSVELAESGVLDKYGVELIGAKIDAIKKAEDRLLFKDAMRKIGLETPQSQLIRSVTDGLAFAERVGYPSILRPSFTMGGSGGGIAYNHEDLVTILERGLDLSPVHEVLIEESALGWKEFELEVMRDLADNVIIVCSIENFDPMGVHTGDSITVAPAQTLTDREYQMMRDGAIRCLREIGVDTGGSNVQFAINPKDGRMVVIEMNPRVSRSSALASKATGYPIAKVAAKLAVGYTLDEIPNDLTKTTPASFEPTLDYVVVKIPRFAFEKFPGADRTLGTQMKSVGETMGIGRTFREAFVKAERGLETPLDWRPENLHPWFERELQRVEHERDKQLTRTPSYRRIDSCAGEVAADSSYYYATWGEADEAPPRSDAPRVVIVGSGPNRIGQGIEFDYCCVHAAKAFRALGYEAIMVNSNPETVSTDYDTSDRLYFEPLDAAGVLAVCRREQPEGVVIQFGGQTPLKLAESLEDAGVRILGTPFGAVDLAEDRERFGRLTDDLGIRVPAWGMAESPAEAEAVAERIGFPVLVRPSYVLGGRAMRICYSAEQVRRAMRDIEGRVLVDRFLEDAVELDVDALADGTLCYIAAVMQHVEEAGVHSGDSSCVLPAPSLDPATYFEVCHVVRRLARGLGVVGLLNVQLAISDGKLYVLEANPRASRTVPFASKATGVNLVEAACRIAAGARISELELPPERPPAQVSVKAAVLPFARFPGADPVLGPEMRSTGEVMASARDFPTAFAKAERAAGRPLPSGGTAFLSVRDADKPALVPIADALAGLGFDLVSTGGTADALRAAGLDVREIEKGRAVVDLIRRRECALVVNTPAGGSARRDGYAIREAALVARIPCVTTLSGAAAAVHAVAAARREGALSLQERIATELANVS